MLNYDCIYHISDYLDVIDLMNLSFTQKRLFEILKIKRRILLKNESDDILNIIKKVERGIIVVEIGKYAHLSKTRVIKNIDNHIRIMTHNYLDIKMLINICKQFFYECKYLKCIYYNNYHGLVCMNKECSILLNKKNETDYFQYIRHPFSII